MYITKKYRYYYVDHQLEIDYSLRPALDLCNFTSRGRKVTNTAKAGGFVFFVSFFQPRLKPGVKSSAVVTDVVVWSRSNSADEQLSSVDAERVYRVVQQIVVENDATSIDHVQSCVIRRHRLHSTKIIASYLNRRSLHRQPQTGALLFLQ